MFNSVNRAAISVLCQKYGVPLAWALGLAEVESAGRAFWSVEGRNVPAINLEGHYFYKYLSGAKRDIATRRGLAHPKAGKTAVPNSFKARYDMLDDWIEIDYDAALMSISMGIGQVMGAHWERLGFKSVRDMWATAQESVAGQVDLMLRYLATDPALMKAIRNDDYKTVARLYNGPAYRRNKYDTKIRAAVKKYEQNVPAKRHPEDTGKGYDPSAELAAIQKLGYETVSAFQRAKGLDPDGIVGPITRQAVEAAVAAAEAAPVKEACKVAVGVGTSGTVVAVGVDAANEVTKNIEAIKPIIDLLKTMGTYGPTISAITVGALVVGTITYMVVRKLRTNAA